MTDAERKKLLVFISHASEDEAAARRLASRLKCPFPPVASMYASAGFVTTNHFALSHLLANRFGFFPRCLARTFHNRYGAAFAQRNPEDFFAYLDNPFVSQVMFVMQACNRCFQARSKLPSRFQTRWQFPALQLSTTRTTRFMLASFDHHWLDLW